ncbi:protein 5NUC [Nasonia vitripennis]|uniref:5'-nucleotidase n=1 Tax=Nasonia vitripennis TaxID=7425 RepID=A0A7M7G5M9_NASVI|nr:protein 5NUC [Nasonia vitripennis]
MCKTATLAGLLLVLGLCAESAPTSNGKFRLRIIHTNDMHSRFEETAQKDGGICTSEDAKVGGCYGGFARLATLVREARANATEDEPVFFLNAGDTYQGNQLFSHYHANIVVKFLNILGPDVASLGNHEFDDGPKGLAPLLNNASFPIVAANLDFSELPILQKTRQLKKSVILEASGRKIGVVGYLTPETKVLSKARNVIFSEEVPAIREEAKKLKLQGCQVIIALGHSGFEVDKKIGREVEEVDLVIGGHTNTFLYNGPKPDLEEAQGLYPTVVVQPVSGKKVYVVQAYAYTKYLGDIRLEFGGGAITSIEGKPILVDHGVAKAEDVEEELKNWLEPLVKFKRMKVGETRVLLDGDERACRLTECNFGNLLTDAMIHLNAQKYEGEDGWTDAAIAIYQAGGIRTSVGATYTDRVNDSVLPDKLSNKNVTMEMLLSAFPFGSNVVKVKLHAKKLREVLEWSVHDRLDQTTTKHGGAFLQYSGLQVTYDLKKPLNSRVVSVRARCSKCLVPSFEDLDMNKTYLVLMPDFMTGGGDGFSMLTDEPVLEEFEQQVVKVVADYINQTSPVYPGLEGRIMFVRENGSQSDAVKSAFPSLLLALGCVSFLRLISFTV